METEILKIYSKHRGKSALFAMPEKCEFILNSIALNSYI